MRWRMALGWLNAQKEKRTKMPGKRNETRNLDITICCWLIDTGEGM
jgi:hypothetical protein